MDSSAAGTPGHLKLNFIQPFPGNQEVCRLLMDSGARMYCVNGIGKTASELSAFVGHHECVAIINNHISIDLIEEFLRPKVNGEYVGDEVYPDELLEFIHSLCGSHEVHPVKIIFRFSKYPDSIKYKKKVKIPDFEAEIRLEIRKIAKNA